MIRKEPWEDLILIKKLYLLFFKKTHEWSNANRCDYTFISLNIYI